MKTKDMGIIVFFQIFIFICGLGLLRSNIYSQREIINHMDGGNAVVQQKDGTWYIDENSGIADGTIFLRGPYERLRKGSYTVVVEYESDWNHSMEIYAEGGHVNADKSIALSKGKNVQKTSIRVTQNIDDFEVRLYYSGKGYIRIDSIVVIRNNEEQRERLLLMAIITAIFDAYFLWLKGNKRFIKVCPILAGIMTGIAISVNGQINEGSSFISTLQRECNGIGIDKLVVSIALIYFYKKQWYLIYEIKSFVIRGLAAVFSVFMIIGISFSAKSGLMFIKNSFSQFLVCALVFMGYYYLFRILIILLFYHVSMNKSMKIVPFEKTKKLSMLSETHPFLLAIMVIIAGWFPFLIVFFPGSVSHDGLSQINQGMGYKIMVNHHPWIVSKIMGLLMRFGQTISDNAGVFLIGITFTILEVLCYGLVCCCIKRHTSNVIYWVSVLYFAIIPVFPAFSNVIIKDGINAAFVAFYIAVYIDCCIKASRKQPLRIKDFMILVLSSLLVCITRKNGIYLVLPQCLCLVVWIREKRGVFGILLLCISIFLGQFITDVALPERLGIVKGSEKEMLSIPFQQTARYLLYAPEDITEKEKAAVDAILPIDQIAAIYNPEISDAVKNQYRYNTEGLKEYFKAWYSMFKKHPYIYVEATLEGSYGYYYPFRSSMSQKYYFGIQQGSIATGDLYLHYLFPREVRDVLIAYAELWLNFPILSQLMNPATYTWLLLVLATYMIYRKRVKGILMYVAPFMNILVCIASPVNGYIRYTIPLMACMPLLVGWCCFYCQIFTKEQRQ